VRAEGLEGRELKDAGDRAAHELLMELLAEHRPDDAVLSEEALESAADKAPGSDASRVWIIDPLDGTREFSEPPRDDWAVHVALWQDGDLVAGAVAQPALGETFNTGTPPVVPPHHERPADRGLRSRPPAFVEALAEELDAELVPMGSAGVKVMSSRATSPTPTCTPAASTSGTPRRRSRSPAPPVCSRAASTAPSCATTRTTSTCPT
jgi:3'(2'), 5'-bisphosphate nucleotidase